MRRLGLATLVVLGLLAGAPPLQAKVDDRTGDPVVEAIERAKAQTQGEDAAATVARWTEAVERAGEDAAPHWRARALVGLGLAQIRVGQREAGETSVNQAVDLIVPGLDGAEIKAEVLAAAGGMDRDSGRMDRAHERYARARTLLGDVLPAGDERVVKLDADIAYIDILRQREDLVLDRMRPADAAFRAAGGQSEQLIINGLIMGDALGRLGRASEASGQLMRTMEESLVLFGPAHPTTVLATETRGMFELGQDNVREGRRILDQALQARRQGAGGQVELAGSLGMAGIAAQMNEDREAALGFYLESAEVFGAAMGERARPRVLSLVNAGQTALELQRFEEAIALLEQARDALASDAGDPHQRVKIAVTLAIAHVETGAFDEALALAADATRRAEQFPRGNVSRAEAAIVRGWVVARAGDPAEGLRIAAPALDELETNFAAGPMNGDRRVAWRPSRALLTRALNIAYLADDREQGFRIAQALIRTDASHASSLAWRRLTSEPGEVAETVATWQRLAEARRRLDHRYLDALASGDTDQTTALSVQVADNQRALEGAEAALSDAVPGYRHLSQARPINLAEAQARLRPSEAMIVSAFDRDGPVTFAITPDRVAWGRGAMSRADIRRDVATLQPGVSNGRDGVDALARRAPRRASFDAAAAHRLYGAILPPAVEAALGDADELIFVTQDGLSDIPFAALLAGPPGQGTPRPWLIRRFAIRASTSVDSVRPAGPVRSPRLFAAGAPRFSGSQDAGADLALVRGGSADPLAIKALPSLPFAAVEIDALGRSFPGGTLLTGDAATEAAVRTADLSQATIVVLATHGLVAGDMGGLSEPALVFTPPASPSAGDDGLLTASEAAMLDLDADWVVLSACNTASGDRPGAPGFTGLARAFLFAGGRNILASHWPVRDDAAARLSVRTITAAAEGQTPAQALRTAMLALMDDPGVPNGSDPSVWAAFTLIGS